MEKENKKEIAVLLTVHNRRDTTIRCLGDLFSNIIPPRVIIRVYMVDDGCTDGTPEAVSKAFPQVIIVKGNGNLYWNRGMWTAWKEAAKRDYDYYMWLNDDTMLYPNAVSVLVDTSAIYHEEAIIVGATQNPKHTRVTYGGRIKEAIPQPNGVPVEVEYFNGNIVLIPRYVFDRVGNLYFYFTHSKGDFDYGLRARKEGIHIIQVGEVLGECDSHPTIDKWCNPDVPFMDRWKAMWKPNGMPPHETYHLEKKHKGLGTALLHYITIYIRCFVPELWKRLKR